MSLPTTCSSDDCRTTNEFSCFRLGRTPKRVSRGIGVVESMISSFESLTVAFIESTGNSATECAETINALAFSVT